MRWRVIRWRRWRGRSRIAGCGCGGCGAVTRSIRPGWVRCWPRRGGGGVSGELMPECEPGYWVRQAREPVRFADAVATLAAQGVSVFLEIGPDGTLSALGPAALGDGDGVFVPVLRPGQPAPAAVIGAPAEAHVRGVPLDWDVVLPAGRKVGLPTYAFQHQRFWPEPAGASAGDMAAAGLAAVGHPLLGAAVELAGGEGYVLTGRRSVRSHSGLAEHVS